MQRLALAVLLWVVPGAALAEISVVTTTQDPAAITRAIGGGRVQVQALAKGYQDPHFLDAKPSYMVQLNRADLVIIIGLDLEVGYIGSLISGARNEKIRPGQSGFLDLSQAVKPVEVAAAADRGQGDIHPNGNPHYWLDPENGRLMARAIAARLSEIDPAGKAEYQKNLAAFERELTAKEAVWQGRMQKLNGKPVVTFHRSWSYFAARYGLRVLDYVEPKPGIPPTPAHTLEVIKRMQESGVKVLLVESYYDRRVPELMAEKTGAKVVHVCISVGGDEGVNTYFDLFDRITGEIDEAAR